MGDERDERDELIIERLRAADGQFVSGTDLAGLLGVSRAAVGKRILNLRTGGLEIEAVPNRGYRLLPQEEPGALEPGTVTPLLNTEWLGRLYLRFDELGSTNDEAARMAAEGAPHGTVVVADAQRAGRGRLDRSWHSPPGENLYLSLILRPELSPRAAPPLSLATAVGIAEGVRGFVGHPPTVKWPNDLLYGDRKFCGVLVELSAAGDAVKHVVIGVGLNVNSAHLPQAVVGDATSLMAERGERVSRPAVLASVLNSLEPWLDRLVSDGPAPVIEAWLALAGWIGELVTVTRPDGGTITGRAVGLDPEGALLLRPGGEGGAGDEGDGGDVGDAGGELRVISGDVKLLHTSKSTER